MDIAQRTAELSTARRLKVGAILVKDNSIQSFGYNGTPAGWDNNCENRIYNTRFQEQPNSEWMDPLTYQTVDINETYPHVDEVGQRFYLKTKPEVIHAEANCLLKVAKSTLSTDGGTMFVTHQPCMECAKLIYQSGINTVYFSEFYRDDSGIGFLKQAGVSVIKLDAPKQYATGQVAP